MANPHYPRTEWHIERLKDGQTKARAEGKGKIKGKPRPIEERLKQVGENNHNYGRVVTDEEKERNKKHSLFATELAREIANITGHTYDVARIIAFEINKEINKQ